MVVHVLTIIAFSIRESFSASIVNVFSQAERDGKGEIRDGKFYYVGSDGGYYSVRIPSNETTGGPNAPVVAFIVRLGR